MDDAERSADIETLAKMAARLAGRDPDEYLKMKLGDVIAFDDYIWRYPDFLNRAEAAYAVLDSAVPPSVSGRGRPAVSTSCEALHAKGGALEENEDPDSSIDERRAGTS
ncbi:MAG: hypothetical protein ACJ8ER_12580 [Allosphingosinicella sp.]